jgi:hypothetical protein
MTVLAFGKTRESVGIAVGNARLLNSVSHDVMDTTEIAALTKPPCGGATNDTASTLRRL